MITTIDKNLAQQIVDTVKDVCGHNINFIDQSGTIFASTNKKRIGSFHEIGHKAFATGTVIEVESDNSFTGTHKGINLPVSHNHKILAVIGISGDPKEVRCYAHLAERITRLLIREKELNAFSRTMEEKKHFLIYSLIGKQKIERKYLEDCLLEFKMDMKMKKRIILIRLDPRYNPVNISMIEQKIVHMFQMMELELYTYDYPNDYLAVIDEEQFINKKYILEKEAEEYRDILKIAVGKKCDVFEMNDSYETTLDAWKSISSTKESYSLYDNMTLEIVISALNEKSRREFCAKTISKLTSEELFLLKTYYEEEMSLTGTGEKLFLHKNTLQYKLNHIHEKTGFNPRHFRDAVLLYLAISMSGE